MTMEKLKKKIDFPLILLLLFVSVLTIFPQVMDNFIYWQDDLIFHRTRLESYFEAVKHLDFFPRVFSSMGQGYGYGADLFYPSILLLPFVLFRLAGAGFVQSYYLYQFFISLATAMSAYWAMKKAADSRNQGMLFTSIYTLSTYRLIDQSVRAALGETLAFIFLPIVAYAGFSIIFKEKNNWILLSIGMSLLIASHAITAFFTAVLLAFFLLFYYDYITKKKLIIFAKAALSGCLLSAWYLLPYFEQTAEISFSFSKTRMWSTGLDYTLGELLLNSLSNVGKIGTDLKPNFGIFLLLMLVFAVLNFKKTTRISRQLTAVTIILIVASTNLFFWSYFKDSFLAVIQFQWRLLVFVTLFGSILAARLIAEHIGLPQNFKLQLTVIALVFLAYSFNGQSFANSESRNSTAVTNQNYKDFDQSEIGHGKEYLVKDSFNEDYFSFPRPRVDGLIYFAYSDKAKSSYKFDQYVIQLDNDSIVQLPKFYYLGYEAKVDGKKTEYYEKDGLVTLDMKAGTHTVTAEYAGTQLQKVSLWLSGAGVALVSGAGVWQRRRADKKPLEDSTK